jgi:DNA-binding transcriptional LysR family regulator
LRSAQGTTVGVYLLPEALVRFRQRFAGIALKLDVGTSDLLRQRLRDGGIEFAVMENRFRRQNSTACCSCRMNWSESCRRIIQLARGKVGVSRDICQRAAGCSRSRARIAFACGARLSPSGSCAFRPVLSLSSTEAVKRAVAAGLGVSIVSKMSLGAEVAAGSSRSLRSGCFAASARFTWCGCEIGARVKPLPRLCACLKHVARGTLPKLHWPGR